MRLRLGEKDDDDLRGSHGRVASDVRASAAVEEAAEEGGDAMAVVRLVRLGGALIGAVVARDARDGLGRGRRGLDIGKARLVVQCGCEGHLVRAALLALPGGQHVVGVLRLLRGRGRDGLLPEPEEASARWLLLAERRARGVGGGTRTRRRRRRVLLLLGRADLLAGDLDGVWLRVDSDGAGGVERVRSGTKLGGLDAGLGDGGSAGAGCNGRDDELLLFERGEGRMLNAAGSGSSEEETESTLGRVIVGIIDWGHRSDSISISTSTSMMTRVDKYGCGCGSGYGR